MAEPICIDSIISKRCPHYEQQSPEFWELVLDPSAFVHSYKPSRHKTIVTQRAMMELFTHYQKISERKIAEIGVLLQPAIIDPGISKEDINFFRFIASKFTGRKDIDYVSKTDAEQLSYAMLRARRNKKTAIVTNDQKLLRLIKRSMDLSEHVKNYVVCIQPDRYQSLVA